MKNYTFDLIGFLEWWHEIIKGAPPTNKAIETITESFHQSNTTSC